MTCLGKPLGQRVLIYSALKHMISLGSSTESALLRLMTFLGTLFCRISFDDNFGFGFKTRITESKSEMIKVAAVNATHSS